MRTVDADSVVKHYSNQQSKDSLKTVCVGLFIYFLIIAHKCFILSVIVKYLVILPIPLGSLIKLTMLSTEADPC